MFDMFFNDFIQDALISSFFISIICGCVGTLVVINRLVSMAGSITHGAYGGLGIGVFFGFALLPSAMIFTMFLALLMAFLMRKFSYSSDTITGVIWAFGMSVGIILIDLSPNRASELLGFLFGSIFIVSPDEIVLISSVSIGILCFCVVFYNSLCAISFDSDFAALRGVKSNLFYYVLIAIIAACVVVSIRVVGLILIIALFCIPSFISSMHFKTLGKIMIFSSFLCMVFCFFGIYISFAFDLSGGACIILVACIGFFINLFFTKILKRVKR